jgi:hypothetical protein
MPHAQGVNVDTITSRCTREPRKLSATAIAVSFTSPDYGALGISPQTTPACRGSTALHPRPTRRAFRDLRTTAQSENTQARRTLRFSHGRERDGRRGILRDAVEGATPCALGRDYTPQHPSRQHNPCQGSTTLHTRQGLCAPAPDSAATTHPEDALFCTFDGGYPGKRPANTA